MTNQNPEPPREFPVSIDLTTENIDEAINNVMPTLLKALADCPDGNYVPMFAIKDGDFTASLLNLDVYAQGLIRHIRGTR